MRCRAFAITLSTMPYIFIDCAASFQPLSLPILPPPITDDAIEAFSFRHFVFSFEAGFRQSGFAEERHSRFSDTAFGHAGAFAERHAIAASAALSAFAADAAKGRCRCCCCRQGRCAEIFSPVFSPSRVYASRWRCFRRCRLLFSFIDYRHFHISLSSLLVFLSLSFIFFDWLRFLLLALSWGRRGFIFIFLSMWLDWLLDGTIIFSLHSSVWDSQLVDTVASLLNIELFAFFEAFHAGHLRLIISSFFRYFHWIAFFRLRGWSWLNLGHFLHRIYWVSDVFRFSAEYFHTSSRLNIFSSHWASAVRPIALLTLHFFHDTWCRFQPDFSLRYWLVFHIIVFHYFSDISSFSLIISSSVIVIFSRKFFFHIFFSCRHYISRFFEVSATYFISWPMPFSPWLLRHLLIIIIISFILFWLRWYWHWLHCCHFAITLSRQLIDLDISLAVLLSFDGFCSQLSPAIFQRRQFSLVSSFSPVFLSGLLPMIFSRRLSLHWYAFIASMAFIFRFHIFIRVRHWE